MKKGRLLSLAWCKMFLENRAWHQLQAYSLCPQVLNVMNHVLFPHLIQSLFFLRYSKFTRIVLLETDWGNETSFIFKICCVTRFYGILKSPRRLFQKLSNCCCKSISLTEIRLIKSNLHTNLTELLVSFEQINKIGEFIFDTLQQTQFTTSLSIYFIP